MPANITLSSCHRVRPGSGVENELAIRGVMVAFRKNASTGYSVTFDCAILLWQGGPAILGEATLCVTYSEQNQLVFMLFVYSGLYHPCPQHGDSKSHWNIAAGNSCCN